MVFQNCCLLLVSVVLWKRPPFSDSGFPGPPVLTPAPAPTPAPSTAIKINALKK